MKNDFAIHSFLIHSKIGLKSVWCHKFTYNDIFPCEEDSRAVVAEEIPPPTPDGHVEGEVGVGLLIELKGGGQEPGEEVVTGVEALPEADKAEADDATACLILAGLQSDGGAGYG